MSAEHIFENYEGPAERARRLVFEQHRELRRLLLLGVDRAAGASHGRGPTEHTLRALIGQIREVFVQHLIDEEALILPLLEVDLPLGPQRAEALHQEHERQRAELRELATWSSDRGDADLAVRFQYLATALLDDIAHEERELLVPEVIRDDQVVIDQSDG